MKTAILALVSITFLLNGCASAPTDEEASPRLVGSTSINGQRFPYGDGSGPYLKLTREAPSKDYGYSQDHPIKVAAAEGQSGPGKERLFLSALLSPDGRPVQFERVGSCCAFQTPNSEFGAGLLDIYEITWDGQDQPVSLYFNMYDAGELYIPKGFKARP